MGTGVPAGQQRAGLCRRDGANRSLAENSAGGLNVGTPVSADDPDGDALTYSLSGADAGSFDIDIIAGIQQPLADPGGLAAGHRTPRRSAVGD